MVLAKLITLSMWAIGPLLQVLILVGMVRRKTSKRYPWFFRYMVFQLVSTYVLMIPYRMGQQQYLYAYWTYVATETFLSFCVLFEIFGEAFRPYETLRDLGRVLLKWALAVMVMVGLVLVLSAPTNESVMVTSILSLERANHVIMCGLLLLLYLFSSQLGISWRNQLYGMVVGFGSYSAVNLIIFSLRARFGPGFSDAASVINTTAYLMTTGVWAAYFLAPATERTLVRGRTTLILERWNQELAAVRHPRPHESFLPQLESVVDSVMTHRAHLD